MESTLSINTEELLEKGVTVFEFLSFSDCLIVRNELSKQSFTDAKSEVGPRNVKQNFQEAELIPKTIPKTMRHLRLLENKIHQSISFKKRVIFNEFRLQKYTPPLELGLGIHKDSRRFQYVVAVIVLELGGKLYVCDDEFGDNPVEVPATLGSCILLKGYVPGELDARRYHYVANVTAPRLTIGCRYDSFLK